MKTSSVKIRSSVKILSPSQPVNVNTQRGSRQPHTQRYTLARLLLPLARMSALRVHSARVAISRVH